MALDSDKQSQMVADYFQLGDAHDIPFGRSDAERQAFFDWFATAAHHWPKSDELYLSSGKYTDPSACFTNAQRNALGSEMEYCEGFYKPSNSSYYVHGFNIKNGKAVDFTSLNNESNDNIEYYGVIIPKELLEEFNPGISLGKGDSLGSLLYRYYLHTRTKSR
jgi:hypothetical protein